MNEFYKLHENVILHLNWCGVINDNFCKLAEHPLIVLGLVIWV